MAIEDIVPPRDFDPWHWIGRWERMQERYLVARGERFRVITRMIQGTQSTPTRILDLGCGPGSLTAELLQAFPRAQVIALDYDPSLLLLARARLAMFRDRAVILRTDLRDPYWSGSMPAPFDAIVSSAALHWLTPVQLDTVYQLAAQMIRSGGIFLNADHVASDSEIIQTTWDNHKKEVLSRQNLINSDTWEGFWQLFGAALRTDTEALHKALRGENAERGDEKGMSLSWHMHALKAHGFVSVDCFWRNDGDAIYGGLRSATFNWPADKR